MKLRQIILLSMLSVSILSCKTTSFVSTVGNINTTKISLSEANFKVLGSYTGTATTKKKLANIKNNEGLVAAAKADLLKKAEKDGVVLTGGARSLSNIVIDVVENSDRVTCTISAEIIEFIK